MALTKLLKTLIKTQKTHNYKHWGSSIVVIKMSSTCNKTTNVNLFSLEDKAEILRVINSKNVEDLLQYSITKKRAETLELYRTDNGPYKSLEDLLQIKGMSDKCLYNFYKSIIHGKKRSSKKITHGLVLTPKTTGDEQKDVKTVLGIYIGSNMISWSLLNRDCEVLQWNYKSFSPDTSDNLHSLFQMILPIAAKLPKADRYIMQEIRRNVGQYQNQKLQQIYVHQSIISTIILSYLTMSNSKISDNVEFLVKNVFILRRQILRRMYGLIVGNEVISTQYVVQKLLQENDNVMGVKENLPNVLIRTELRHMYDTQSPIYQDQISWSLLIALAFMELVVHQRTDMIVRNAK